MNTMILLNSIHWQEARERAETHLLSYGMVRDDALQQLVDRIIEVASARHQLEPWREPVGLAAAETERVIRERVERTVSAPGAMSPHAFAQARASLHLSRDEASLRATLSADDKDDDDTTPNVEPVQIHTGPTVRLSNMVPEPMHYDMVKDVANETWRAFARWPAIRSSLTVMLAASGLGSALYLANF